MKLLALIISIIILNLGCHSSPNVETLYNLTEVEYVKDQNLFKQESDSQISDLELRAIRVAKIELERIYGAKVKGHFSVAKSQTGYHINFHSLMLKRTLGRWYEIKEGYGEVFVSHDFSVQYAAVGP